MLWTRLAPDPLNGGAWAPTTWPSSGKCSIEANLGPTSPNPHIFFFEGRHRGYTLCEVTPERWRAGFRIVDTLTDPNSAVRTASSWVVDAGTPGVRPA